LAALSPTFDQMYSKAGRPSIPPERLLKATLLMAFYSVRSSPPTWSPPPTTCFG